MLLQKYENNGLCPKRLAYLEEVIQDDVNKGKYYGAQIHITRGGEVGLNSAIGWAKEPGGKKLEKSDILTLFSLSKGFTNVLGFKAIENGQFAFTQRVSEVIPEFSGGLREQITFLDLFTHRIGIPTVFSPIPTMPLDVFDDMLKAIYELVHCTSQPGEEVSYAPMLVHALIGEAVRRTDPKKRNFRDIAHEELFEPLGMTSTAFGVRKDLKPRHQTITLLPTTPLDPHPGSTNSGRHGAFEEEFGEMPWVGAISCAEDVGKFAQMLCNGGELNGKRIIGPAIIDQATQNRTGDRINNLYASLAVMKGRRTYPAYIGLGFFLRGEQMISHQFGTLSSPRTFGGNGFGSTVYWIDPARDMTFSCLTTGVMNEGDNIDRFQRLSDIALSAAL